MEKILLWGTGGFFREWLPTVTKLFKELDYKVIGFIDNDPKKNGQIILNVNVYLPKEIINIDYNKIIIMCSEQYVCQIYEQLLIDLSVPSSKILTIYDLLKKRMAENRNKMLVYPQKQKVKIYDCILFFNEIDLLEIRLETLYKYVDYFVIVELGKTFRGKEKILYYKLYEDKFKKYRNKIIYLHPDDIPIYKGAGDFAIQTFQRECIIRGLENCGLYDVVCISDCDEFPNPELLVEAKEDVLSSSRNMLSVVLDENPVVLEQKCYYYYMNCKRRKPWYGSVLIRYQNIFTTQLREWSLQKLMPYAKNGGWHFSYMGGKDRIKEKMDAIVGSALLKGEYITEYQINDRMGKGIDLYERNDELFDFIDIKKLDFPNIEKWLKKYPYLVKKTV